MSDGSKSEQLTIEEVLREKERDMRIAGLGVPFTPEEAEHVGAYVDDALDPQYLQGAALDVPLTK